MSNLKTASKSTVEPPLKAKALKQRKFWIFDMDGTLTNSAHDFVHMREVLNLEPGAAILEVLSAMPQAQAAPLWTRLNELEFFYADQSTIMQGAVELLEQLTASGYKLAILTRNTMPVVTQTLKACGLDHFFPTEHILDRDSCEPKPSPAGIEYLLKLWNAKPADAVMVGDYLYDLEAGTAAGVATIHIDQRESSSDKPDWSELTDLRVEEINQIRQLLNA